MLIVVLSLVAGGALGVAAWVLAVPLGMFTHERSTVLPVGAISAGARWETAPEAPAGPAQFDASGIADLPGRDGWVWISHDPRLLGVVLHPELLPVEPLVKRAVHPSDIIVPHWGDTYVCYLEVPDPGTGIPAVAQSHINGEGGGHTLVTDDWEPPEGGGQ